MVNNNGDEGEEFKHVLRLSPERDSRDQSNEPRVGNPPPPPSIKTNVGFVQLGLKFSFNAEFIQICT